ncbi:cysteine hydrolase family protein [Marinomonas epiphytica]
MKPLLMIIDMQQGMSWPQAGQRNNPNAEYEIRSLLSQWRVHKAPVIHIRHHSRDPDSLFWPEQDGALFQAAFEPEAHEKQLTKSVPDAFIHSELESWLHQQKITEVVVVGVSTNNSVEATVRSSGNLGFNTYVVHSACFTFDKQDFHGQLRSAADVHAMSLANLHQEYAQVIDLDKALSLLTD